MSRLPNTHRSPTLAFVLSLATLCVAGPVANGQVSVLSSTVEEYSGAPGESYVARIDIANASNKPQVVRLYQTDYHFAANGTSDFDPPSSFAHSNATWIALQSERVTVPAAGTLSVPYTVTIPKADSLRGTYWSAVMVEPVEHMVAASASGTSSPQMGLGTIVRYAVQVATHINASGTRTVRFDGVGARRSDESTTNAKSAIELDVANTGERAYRPALWIEVYDAQGKLRATSKQQRGLLYPGCSLRQRFELAALPAGTYKAVIFADTGEETVYASQYAVVF